ncbi:MAG: TetR/AcrR family transcriptional regulator [Rhizobacter sp.]
MTAKLSQTTQRFAAKQEAILDAAARVFNAKGLRGGTLADIAGHVGLATNSITYYYRRHEDLAVACLLRTVEALNRVIDKAQGLGTPVARVNMLFEEWLRVLGAIERSEHPELMTFADARALEEPSQQQVFPAYTAASNRMLELLKGPETAHLSRQALLTRNYLLVSQLSWMRLWTPGCHPEDFSTIARRGSDLMLNGLVTDESSWPSTGNEAAFWEGINAKSKFADPFLGAAATSLNRHGFHGASITRISAYLNLTKGAFYGRGTNKDELITACFEKKASVIQMAWTGLDHGSASGWERLSTAMRRLIWFQLSGLGPLVRTTAILAVPGDDFQHSVREMISRSGHQFADVVIDGMMDGSIRPCDPTLVAHSLMCTIDHAAGVSGWARSVDTNTAADMYLKPCLLGLFKGHSVPAAQTNAQASSSAVAT